MTDLWERTNERKDERSEAEEEEIEINKKERDRCEWHADGQKERKIEDD